MDLADSRQESARDQQQMEEAMKHLLVDLEVLPSPPLLEEMESEAVQRPSPPSYLVARPNTAVKPSPSSRHKKRRRGAPACISTGKEESPMAAAVTSGAMLSLPADVMAATSNPPSSSATALSSRLAAAPPMPSSARCSEATLDELEESGPQRCCSSANTNVSRALLQSSQHHVSRALLQSSLRHVSRAVPQQLNPRHVSRMLPQSSPRRGSRKQLQLSPRHVSRVPQLCRPSLPQPPLQRTSEEGCLLCRGHRKRDASDQVIGGPGDASAQVIGGPDDASAPAYATEGPVDASASGHATEGHGAASASAHATEGLGDASASAHATEGLCNASASAHLTESLVLVLVPDEGFKDEPPPDPVPVGLKKQLVLVLASEGSPDAASVSEGPVGSVPVSKGPGSSASAPEGSPQPAATGLPCHVPEEPVGGLPPRPGPEHLLGFLWGVFTELQPDSRHKPDSGPDCHQTTGSKGHPDSCLWSPSLQGPSPGPLLQGPSPSLCGSCLGPSRTPGPSLCSSCMGPSWTPGPSLRHGSGNAADLWTPRFMGFSGLALTACIFAAWLLICRTEGPLLCSVGLPTNLQVPIAVAGRHGLYVSVGLPVSIFASRHHGLYASAGLRVSVFAAGRHGLYASAGL
ncbi:hypothetical protein CRENBAI_020805 [Crenichthys baileyi]|uniref:Uncharacterized protein n=1 Tax=Crenichthys baileyi TaxID=28760 RepID=A0AAV9SR66_9TELE